MPADVPLSRRERLTLVAALRYWRDEMLPYPDIQLCYFDDPAPELLTEAEIESLGSRLRAP